ncbi:MAG TPA: methionyl-tRNA formyltransferase [Actinomycetota bacterium]|nr:methionyl-tRNA formyltransferase [Actinomycetota bacterium]
MRVAFLGNDRRSVPSLEALARSSHQVVLVVCRPPVPAGRGGRLSPAPTAEAARSLGLPLLETATVKEGEGWERLAETAPDALAVVAYGEILPARVLELPAVAPVNVHFSLLPALRGADPVRRALLEGLTRTGVTAIRMDEGMDTGPILLREEVAISDGEDAGSLGSRLADLGGDLLVRALDALEDGSVRERPQGPDGATMAPKLGPEEEWIDWSEGAEAVWRRVRALAPEPGARTRFRDRLVKVLRVTPADGAGDPGAILEGDPLTVAAGGGAVVLDEVVPEGRRPMGGSDFARGQRLRPGERFG